MFSVLHEIEEMVPNSSLSLRLWIAEGLLNRNTWVGNCDVSRTGLNWFAERKLFFPCISVWNFDRGKLVTLNVSIEYNPLETVMKSRSQVTEVVRKTRIESGKIRIPPAIISSFKEIFKVAYFNARAIEMWDPVQSFGKEGEEDFMPMGIVTLTFC